MNYIQVKGENDRLGGSVDWVISWETVVTGLILGQGHKKKVESFSLKRYLGNIINKTAVSTSKNLSPVNWKNKINKKLLRYWN